MSGHLLLTRGNQQIGGEEELGDLYLFILKRDYLTNIHFTHHFTHHLKCQYHDRLFLMKNAFL